MMIVLLMAIILGASADFRVINGRRAAKGQFPWMVHISACSASIVDKYTVLTAGHCVCKWPAKQIKVNVLDGFVQNEPGVEIYEVEKNIIHPGYAGHCGVSQSNDFAILKLKTPIKFSSKVQPIPLYCKEAPRAGNPIRTMGYGGDHNNHYEVLNYADTHLIDCPERPGYYCSKRQPNSVYYGDSGGPMVFWRDGKYQQLGVNSAISEVSMYAKVPDFCDWISSHSK